LPVAALLAAAASTGLPATAGDAGLDAPSDAGAPFPAEKPPAGPDAGAAPMEAAPPDAGAPDAPPAARPAPLPAPPAGASAAAVPPVPLAPQPKPKHQPAATAATAGTATSAPFTLTTAPPYRIHLVGFRFTHFDQTGLGYQSAAGLPEGPGSERVTIEQPQAEVVASLGDRLVQRVRLPVDVVTAASPDHSRYGRPANAPPLDAVSSASRSNLAAGLDSITDYRWNQTTNLRFRGAFHFEEPFQSLALGLGVSRSLADDNAVLSASFHQIVDSFDDFDLSGERYGRAGRTSTNGNLGVTQVLTTTTVVHANYGVTLQSGTLSNTWNSVPLTDGTRGEERVPRTRWRHALGGRLAQWLPWRGAIRLGYRYYLDSWDVAAHSLEVTLAQRVGDRLTLEGRGRVHRQAAVGFFGTIFPPDDGSGGPRTADSDLAGFVARSLGASLRWDQPIGRYRQHRLFVDLGVERYQRSNDLRILLFTCGAGWRQ
jgi:hypothetical protein